MLGWIKRMAGPVPQGTMLEAERDPAAVKIERLATRLNHAAPHVTSEPVAVFPALAAPDVARIAAPVEVMPVDIMAGEIMPPPLAAMPAPVVDMPAAAIVSLPAPVVELPSRATARPKVIAVVSQKGGSGKTTITAHLAVRAAEAGDGPVLLIDTDPQHSLTDWWQARDDDALSLLTLSLDDLPAALSRACGSGAGTIIIDTPPALTHSIEQVLAIADLVVVPARPSPHDLRAVGATVGMTRAAKKPFLFVVNGAAPRANITAEAVAALSEHGRVAPVILYQRTEFAGSMIDGRTVMESAPNGRSAQEVADLWKFVSAQLSLREAA